MTPRVTCIIPAWNEADRLGAVLSAVVGHPDIHEVIVIDDASTDATRAVGRALGAKVLSQSRNSGKSAAVARGLSAARGDLVLLLDADLVGLTTAHVSDLIAPVLRGTADVTVSLRANAPLPWRIIGLDYISGERVFPRSLIADQIGRIGMLNGFGLEVFLNEIWIARKLRVRVVSLPIRSPLKAAKHGALRGVVADIRMLRDILGTVGLWRMCGQIRRLAQRLS